jgi:hypothetical protein
VVIILVRAVMSVCFYEAPSTVGIDLDEVVMLRSFCSISLLAAVAVVGRY